MTPDLFRRRFLRHSVAMAIACPGLAMAQAPGGTRRVAAMMAGDPAAASHLFKALVGGLAELGWVEGRNLHLDVRYGENDATRFRRLADELLALRPDVFVAGNEPVARVVAPLTNTVPIVVPLGFDLVGSGLVQSLARDAADLGRAIAQAAGQKARGMLGAADSFFYQHRVVMTDLAIKHGIAHVGSGIENAAAGSLFSYGPNFSALFRRSGALVDKILKGAKPTNIPVEQANVYELVVNLKTARALGIKLPPSFLLQATQTIE